MQDAVRPAVHVARGASFLIARTMLIALISLAAFAVIARMISRADMGALAVLTLVASGGTLLSGLGVGSTVTRFVASLRSKEDFSNMRMAAYECLLINATATIIIAGLTYVSSSTLAQLLLGSAARANLFSLLSWEILALGMYYSILNLALGLKLFKELSIIAVGAFCVRQGMVVLLLIRGFGLPGIVIGWGIGDSLNSLLLLAVTLRSLGPLKIGFGLGKLMKFSAPLFFGEAANYTWTYFDRGLLLPLVSLSELGAYNVAVTAYGILTSLPGSISSALFPTYSGYFRDGTATETAELEAAINTASRYVSFFTIPLAVGLAVTALPAATFLAGPNYSDSAYPLAILSLFLAASCMLTALGSIFIVLGKSVTSAMVTIVSILIPIMLGLTIVPVIGITGAALARGTALVISLVITLAILRNKMKLKLDLGAYVNSWSAALMMALAVLVFQIEFYSKLLLPVYIIFGGFVFLLSLRLLHAVNSKDISLLSSFLTPHTRFLANWLARIMGVDTSNAAK